MVRTAVFYILQFLGRTLLSVTWRALTCTSYSRECPRHHDHVINESNRLPSPECQIKGAKYNSVQRFCCGHSAKCEVDGFHRKQQNPRERRMHCRCESTRHYSVHYDVSMERVWVVKTIREHRQYFCDRCIFLVLVTHPYYVPNFGLGGGDRNPVGVEDMSRRKCQRYSLDRCVNSDRFGDSRWMAMREEIHFAILIWVSNLHPVTNLQIFHIFDRTIFHLHGST